MNSVLSWYYPSCMDIVNPIDLSECYDNDCVDIHGLIACKRANLHYSLLCLIFDCCNIITTRVCLHTDIIAPTIYHFKEQNKKFDWCETPGQAVFFTVVKINGAVAFNKQVLPL